MLETAEKTGKKKHDKNEREDWRTVGELLINPPSFTQLAQSHSVSGFPAAWSLSDLQMFCSKSTRCRLLEYKQTFFGVVVLVFFYAYSSPYALRLLCFALFPRLSPWQPWQLGTPAKVLPLFYLLGRFERLRCPETFFISHENANFLFSVFRVVQSEAKTPKIMGCCRANFAFLHALNIGTFRGKWTLKWVFKTSHFVCLALHFLITSKHAF